MDYEDLACRAWRAIETLRFAPPEELADVRVMLMEIRDRLEEVLA